MSRIVVIGGHGKIALRLERLLSAQGHEVDAIIRRPDQSEDVAATGATPVVADVQSLDVAGLADLLRGHDAVVWSAGAGGGAPERTYAVDRDAAIRSMDAAQDAGVRRYVMVSYFGAGPNHGVPKDDPFFAYADAKAAADAHLEQSSLEWTIVAPSTLTDDPGTGEISLGGDAGKVSRDDVAAVVAFVLADPATAGRVIDFNNGTCPIEKALTTGC